MLIAMAVHSTVENGRTGFTERTIQGLVGKVGGHHRLFICDDASCDETKQLYDDARNWLPFVLIESPKRRGTARSINAGWVNKYPGEVCCKLDDDMIVHDEHWTDRFEDALS